MPVSVFLTGHPRLPSATDRGHNLRTEKRPLQQGLAQHTFSSGSGLTGDKSCGSASHFLQDECLAQHVDIKSSRSKKLGLTEEKCRPQFGPCVSVCVCVVCIGMRPKFLAAASAEADGGTARKGDQVAAEFSRASPGF